MKAREEAQGTRLLGLRGCRSQHHCGGEAAERLAGKAFPLARDGELVTLDRAQNFVFVVDRIAPERIGRVADASVENMRVDLSSPPA